MSNAEHASRVFPPCCPDLQPGENCDVIDFQYRQLYPVTVGDQRRPVTVEVILKVRLERCSGPLALGDLVYSTTLFPGEKVRLFTSDRRNRFTFDSSSQISYRHEQSTEEHFYMSSWSDFMSDLTIKDSGRSTNTNKAHFDTHGETSGAFESFLSGPSIDVSGNYNSSSTSEFLRELSQHARSSHRRAEMGSRASSSVSIGEVQTRTHSEGESQDHFESSSREFSNPNRCHAITFYFYRINKTQTVKFTLESIERRVIDPAADTRVTNNPFTSRGNVSVIPAGVLATDTKRLEVERLGQTAGNAELQTAAGRGTFNPAFSAFGPVAFVPKSGPEPLPADVRADALKAVDQDLVKAGLLDKVGGVVTKDKVTEISFESKFTLPTPGVFVRGCLDE